MLIVPALFILAALLYLQHLLRLRETAASSPGTLMQLVAKGPQDAYLTGYRPYGLYYGYRMQYPYLYWRAYPYSAPYQYPWFWWRQRYPYLRKWHR